MLMPLSFSLYLLHGKSFDDRKTEAENLDKKYIKKRSRSNWTSILLRNETKNLK